MEMVFLMVWKARQNIEFQKSRSLVQALLSQKGAESHEIEKAFADLKEAFFPFDRNVRKAELEKMRMAMADELKRGPLSVMPLQDITKRRFSSKLTEGETKIRQRASMLQEGKIVDIDTFRQAQRRPRNVS